MSRAIVLTPATWRRISRLLNTGDSGLGALGNTAGRGSRWCIVRCDSATPIGASTGNYLDQMYPATIVFASSDVSYPPLGPADDKVIGDGCLLTVLGTDDVSGDAPYAMTPVAGNLYAGQLTAEVDADPDIAAYTPARRRLIAIDHYGTGAGGGGGPAGVDGAVQFNDGGAFGADAPFSYDKTLDTLSLTNLDATGGIAAGGGITNWDGNISAFDGAGTAYVQIGHNAGLSHIMFASESAGSTFFSDLEYVPTGGPGGASGNSHLSLFDNITGARRAFSAGAFGIIEPFSTTWGVSGTGGTVTAVNGIVTGIAAGGTGTVTSVSGGTTGLSITNATTTPTLGGILNLANGGTGAALSDPNADRFLGWDDSAGAMIFFASDASLVFAGTNVGVGELDMGTW